jgi:hypothetical protein
MRQAAPSRYLPGLFARHAAMAFAVSCAIGQAACGGNSDAISMVDTRGDGRSADAGRVTNGATPTKRPDADAGQLLADAGATLPASESPQAPPDALVEPDVLAGFDAGTGCHRVVNFEGVVLLTPPPFDVVIVADHSESLSWSRDDLARGLSDLATNLYGHTVRFFVLTPTQYDATSEKAIDLETGASLVNWRNPTTLEPYTNGMTRYVEKCTDDVGNELLCPDYPPPPLEFELEADWEFVMPEPVAELDSNMTTDELEAQRSKVVDAILGLGAGGSPEEQPLCTLGRYLDQAPQLLPERAVFLVISDEDDTASVTGCFDHYSYKQYATESGGLVSGCTENCSRYTFTAYRTASSNTLQFACAPVDDFGAVGSEDTWISDTVRGATTDTCAGETLVACTDAENATAQSECAPGYQVQNCMRACVEGGAEAPCGLSSTDQNLDLCTEPFESGGVEYANMIDFCEQTTGHTGFGRCGKVGYGTGETPIWIQNAYLSPRIQASTLGDLIHLFHADADRAFGPENYFVETIVFDQSFACMPQAGQSYATQLETIATSPEHVFPICESYAPALQQVDDFAQELLQTEYSFELGKTEQIDGVTVESRDGTTRELASDDYQYDDATSTLDIDRAALQSSDLRLSVQVVDPCVPNAR